MLKKLFNFFIYIIVTNLIFLSIAKTETVEKLYINSDKEELWEDITKAYLDPLSIKTGLKFELVLNPNLDNLENMVNQGKCNFHVIELEIGDFILAVERKLLQEINYSIVDYNNLVANIHKKPNGYEFLSYSEVIAYKVGQFPNGGPKNMADFWNTDKYPGPKTLKDDVVGNLEFALEADGVDSSEVYKVLATSSGVERAFKKLDELKPHIVKFWTSESEPIQMLSEGKVTVAIARNGNLEKIKNAGLDIFYTFQDGNLNTAFYSIPASCSKDSARVAAIYLNAWNQPDWVIEWVKLVPNLTFTSGIEDELSKNYDHLLPNNKKNLEIQFKTNWAFWSTNFKKLNEKWKKWRYIEE